MDLFTQTIHEFGRHLGMDSLAPAQGGCVDLAIENVGRFQIEKDDDMVNLILARPRPQHSENTARTALALCHWRENHPWPIHAGLIGEETLLFVARMPVTTMDVPTLDRALAYLSELLDRVEKAG